MTDVEKVFALKVLPPFNRLRDVELTLIARVAEVHQFAPGTVVHPDTGPFRRVYLRTSGAWLDADGPLPAILGVGSVLFGQPAPGPVTAGPEGATCFAIQKTQLHTIASETPELLLGFMALPAGKSGGHFL